MEFARKLEGGAKWHEVEPTSSRSGIVRRGFKVYQDMAKEQEENLSNGEVVSCLCIGLERLVNVQKIEFGWGWKQEHIPGLHAPLCQILRTQYWRGSPLARSWHPLFLAPTSLNDGNFEALPSVVRALAITGRTIKSLHCYEGIPSDVFDPKSYVTQSFLKSSTKVLQELKHFKFYSYMEADSGCIDILPRILQSMTGLESLLIGSDIACPASISKVFGIIPHSWPHLSSLSLCSYQCSASELLGVVLIQPKLKSLELDDFNLLSGDWKDVFDHLQNQLKLNAFELGWPLVDAAGIELWNECTEGGMAFRKKLENYVLHGGLNPLTEHSVGSLHTDITSGDDN